MGLSEYYDLIHPIKFLWNLSLVTVVEVGALSDNCIVEILEQSLTYVWDYYLHKFLNCPIYPYLLHFLLNFVCLFLSKILSMKINSPIPTVEIQPHTIQASTTVFHRWFHIIYLELLIRFTPQFSSARI